MSMMPSPNDLESKSRETWVWRRVIARAFEEADGMIVPPHAATAQYAAQKWLTRPSRGYYEVCHYAGLTCGEVETLIKLAVAKYGKVGSKEWQVSRAASTQPSLAAA